MFTAFRISHKTFLGDAGDWILLVVLPQMFKHKLQILTVFKEMSPEKCWSLTAGMFLIRLCFHRFVFLLLSFNVPLSAGTTLSVSRTILYRLSLEF